MVNIFGFELGNIVPAAAGSSAGSLITILLTIFIISVIICIGIWFWIDKKTYNKKIIVFENISGQGYQPTIRDTARLVKIGDGGEEILYLKKKKVYRTAYGKKMGINTYWFAVGQDGYWYNILLGDLDAKMGMLDVEPIDRDMRYMHVAIRKNITERYRKLGFMDKYGTMVFSFVLLLIFFIGMWFVLKQQGDLINQGTQTVEMAKTLIEPIKEALSKVDAICSGGSGIR